MECAAAFILARIVFFKCGGMLLFRFVFNLKKIAKGKHSIIFELQISQHQIRTNCASTPGRKIGPKTKKVSRNSYAKKVRGYIWGGVGSAKTPGGIGLCLEFFCFFLCVKTKKKKIKPKRVRRVKNVSYST